MASNGRSRSGHHPRGLRHGWAALGLCLGREDLREASFEARSLVWLVFSVVLIAAFGLEGRYDAEVMTTVLWLVPAVPVGIVAGEWLHDRVEERRFKRLIFGLLMLASVSVVCIGVEMLDLIIKGGTLVDGAAASRNRPRDPDGRIVGGLVTGTAKQTIDADGAIVTGFTDIHTHYDGQVTWDEEMAVVAARRHDLRDGQLRYGLCAGSGADRERLVRLMEASKTSRGARSPGIRWGWETFPGTGLPRPDAPHHRLHGACPMPSGST